MRLTLATLCDHAQVREGLLSLLGGNITSIGRSEFPAPLGADTAVSFTIDPDDEPGPIEVLARLIGPEVGEVWRGGVSIDIAERPPDLEPFAVVASLVLPTAPQPVPSPGAYVVEVWIDRDGVMPIELPFDASLVELDPSG